MEFASNFSTNTSFEAPPFRIFSQRNLKDLDYIERLTEAGRMVLKNAPFSLLVEGHGLYTWGASLEEARRHTEITEFLLDVHWRELLLQSKR